jgi:putative NADH-flavin reductase
VHAALKLAVVGATGRVGSAVVRAALDAGHDVSALVHNPGHEAALPGGLRLVHGDIRDEQVARRLAFGRDAVVCALGADPDTRVLSEGTGSLVRALPVAGVRRLVAVLCGWVFFDPAPESHAALAAEHRRSLAVLEGSGLDWTAVCPPAEVGDTEPTGRWAVTPGAMPPGARRITRADLAGIVIAEVTTAEHLAMALGVAN